MRAALLRDDSGKLVIEDVSIDKPQRDEVLIQTLAAGLCHSDLHFIDGSSSSPHAAPYPMLLGHEGAGIVQAVGEDVRDIKPGDHVAICGAVYCGYCSPCLEGRAHLCENRAEAANRPAGQPPRITDTGGNSVAQLTGMGSFAEEMLVHQNGIVKVPKEMPFDSASIVSCAVLTGAGAVFHNAKVTPGSTVAVIGCGGIGTSVIQAAHISGASMVIAIDLDVGKLESASIFGATHTLNPADGDTVARVLELTSGGVDYSFEAIGLKPTAEQAFQMVKRGGRATILGMSDAIMDIPVPDLFRDNKILTGSLMGSTNFRVGIPQLCDLYMAGRLKLDEMISKRVSLDEVNEGFDAMKSGEVVRSVIDFS